MRSLQIEPITGAGYSSVLMRMSRMHTKTKATEESPVAWSSSGWKDVLAYVLSGFCLLNHPR